MNGDRAQLPSYLVERPRAVAGCVGGEPHGRGGWMLTQAVDGEGPIHRAKCVRCGAVFEPLPAND